MAEKERCGSGLPIHRKQDTNPLNRITVHEKGDLVYLTFPILEKMEGIIHGFSTRRGW